MSVNHYMHYQIFAVLYDVQVWPHHRRNLLLVERYHFFPGAMRPVNGVSGLLDLVSRLQS